MYSVVGLRWISFLVEMEKKCLSSICHLEVADIAVCVFLIVILKLMNQKQILCIFFLFEFPSL